MKRYAVNFIFGIIVDADDEDEAIKLAKKEVDCNENYNFDFVEELAPDTFKQDSEEAAGDHENPQP